MSAPKYNATIDVKNINNSHSLAFHFISEMRREQLEVLEIGCSSGYFGAALRSEGHIVTGIEPDEKSATHAKNVLNNIYCGFAQDFFRENPNKKFDVITFGDVLEHLSHPLDALLQAKEHLHDGGRIIISVPNISHGSIRAMLLNGDWQYSDLGILDRTHLRFFTKESLIELIHQAGMRIRFIQPVRLSIIESARMCNIKLNAKRAANVLDIHDDDTINDFQYVAAIEKGTSDPALTRILSNKNPLKVLILADDPASNITKLRLELPLQQWAWEGGRHIRLINYGEFTAEDLEWADVFILQRGHTKKALQAATLVAAKQKPLVYEIDDLLTEIPEFLNHHKEMIRNRKYIIKCMEYASLITVTTDRLAKALQAPPQKVAICPNYARPTTGTSVEFQPLHTDQSDCTALIIASSDRVLIEFLIQPLKEIKSRFQEKVKFIIIGPITEKFKKSGLDGDFHEIIPYESFSKLLRQQPNPIGIIPLDESSFSSCKSPVKYFDYTAAGLPVLCSNVPPYADVIIDGTDGILVKNEKEAWVSALVRIISDHEFRKQLLVNAQRKVATEHEIKKTTAAWRRVFEQIAPNDTPVKQRRSLPALSHLRLSLQKTRLELKKLNKKRRIKRRLKRMASNEA